MTLTDYYNQLPSEVPKAPKSAFVRKIAGLCMVSEHTVRMWLAGAQKPDALKRSVIAEELGIDENELFPTSSDE